MSKPFPLIEQVRAVLPADGWTLRAGDDWCYVVPPDYPFVSQGWKVHVSATPLSALLVLHRCAKVLVELGYAFKFAPTFDRLMDLLNRDADRGSAGKFLTVYPPEGADLTRLMAELHRQTSGLPGPQILSDRPYAPRSLVHLRYGAHVDAPRLTDEGELRTPLVAPDGSFVPDRREAWFTMPDWAELPIPASPDEDDEPDLLLAGRYRVHTAIQQANKGGVYQARDELADRDVIVKQARAHVGATLSGQDSQTLLRAEADALDALHRYGVCPRKLDLFTLGDSLFLVEEALEGETLADWVTHRLQPGSRFDDMLPAPEIRDLATRIVDLVVTVHAAGLRLGDLTPSNLMVCADGAVRCIDLEGAGRFGTPAAPIGTHAYQPPELPGLVAQQADPGVEGDLHALGGVLFFLVTGADPAILADDTRHDRLARMLDLLAPVTALRAGILGLMADDPAVRWPLDRVRAWPSGDFQRGSSEEPTLGELLDDLVERISGGGAAGFDARTVCAGAAGRLALLTRADPRGPAVDALVGQLYADPPAGPVLPGLYTGTAGVAWAGFDLAQARGDDPGRALALARQIPTDWHVPDVFHGLAGAGLTFAHLWRQGAGEEFRGRVVACADNLSKQAVETANGLMWRLPDGRAAYGFAHGVAGIGTFLSVAAEITGDDRYRELAIRAGQTLAANAQGDGDAAWWYADPVEQEIGGYPVSAAHWCNGASGVGTFVLRLGFVDLARRAATTVLREARGATVCYCHGLAGNGDFLLDMADRLGEEKYRDGAERLARLIAVTAARKDGRLVTPDDTKKAVSAGFATGTTGTAIFLHRLLYGGPRWGMASLD